MISFELFTSEDKSAFDNAADFEDKSEEGCLNAVRDNGFNIQFIEDPTDQMIVEACMQNGLAIYYIPKEKQNVTAEINGEILNAAMEAVKQNGLAIKYIYFTATSEDVCLEAVKQNPNAFVYINGGVITYTICKYMLDLDSKWYEFVPLNIKLAYSNFANEVTMKNPKMLEWVPKEQQYVEKYGEAGPIKLALMQDPDCIKYVRAANLTVEEWVIIHEIVKSLKYIPNNIRAYPDIYNRALAYDGREIRYLLNYADKEMYLTAVKQNGLAIQYIPEVDRSTIIISAALKNTGLAIKYLNKKSYRSIDWKFYCDMACQYTPQAYEFVEGGLLSDGTLKKVLKEDYTMTQFLIKEANNINKNRRIDQYYQYAVEQNGRALQYVNKSYQTFDMCYKALIGAGSMYMYIHDENTKKNKYIISRAVEYDGLMLGKVPTALITYANCKAAVKNNGLALQYVPEAHMDLKLCLEAVNNNIMALKYVPDNYLPIIEEKKGAPLSIGGH